MKVNTVLAATVAIMMLVSGLGILAIGRDSGNADITPSSQPAPPQTTAFTKVNKVAMWEDFTQWNCAPCAAYNPYLAAATNTYPGGWLTNVAPTFLHVWWPTTDNDPMHNSPYPDTHWYIHNKVSYYGVGWVPQTFIGGIDYPETSNEATIETYFDQVRAGGSNISISSWGYLNTAANTGYVKIHAECVAPQSYSDLRLYCHLWESNITRLGSGTNGETSFDWVLWQVLPTANGTSVSMNNPGDYIDIQYNFTYDAAWVDSNIGASIFFQDIPTKKIEQAKTELFQKPSVSLTSPAPRTGNQILSGTVPVSWSTIDTQSGTNVQISLDYSTNDGSTWTNIVTGLANTPPYNWNTASIGDSPSLKLRVTATDPNTMTNSDSSWEFFSVDNTADERWYLQVQNANLAGHLDLDMKPCERTSFDGFNQTLRGPYTSLLVPAMGDYVVQSFASAYTASSTMDLAGQWNFSMYGKADNCTPQTQGNLFARVYGDNGAAQRLLFETGLAADDVGSYLADHAFNWSFAVPSGTTIDSGEHVMVEILYRSTSGTPTATYNRPARLDKPNYGTVTNNYTRTFISDNQYETIQEVLINPAAYLVSENFTSTTFPPTGWGQSGTATNPAIWSRSVSTAAGGSPPAEAKLTYVNQNNVAGWRLYCGPINTVGMTSLDLKWRSFIDDYAAGYTLRVQTATASAGPWTNSPWSYTGGSGNRGPMLETTTLTANVGSATLYFCFWLTGNCYNIDYWYVDDVTLQQTQSTSALEHKWTIDVFGGEDPYTFSVEANRPASADNDDFTFAYSTDDSTYTDMVTVSATTDTTYTYVLPASLSGTVYIRVRDTIRTNGQTTLSTVNIDQMRIISTDPPKVILIYDSYGDGSYVEPKLGPASSYVPWINITVVAGWNLISVPYNGPTALPGALTDMVNGGAGFVVWDRVQVYSPATPTNLWKQYYTGWGASLNDLSAVDNMMGVWIYVTTVGDGQICLGGAGYSNATSTVTQIKTGWNLVGFPSDDSAYTVAMLKADTGATIVEGWVNTPPYYTTGLADPTPLAMGKAYWIYCPSDTSWTKAW
ncbi:MAG: hypothetical protein HZB92_00605 [Euryarchaeota archaeon]|nr:hypothetical protein [Euryarchaeota archaeon]